MPWWLWVLLGVLALAGESVSMALFLGYAGVAAFVTAVLSALQVGAVAQVVVFVVLLVVLLALVRPRMLQALGGRVSHRTLTNEGPLVHRLAVVTQPVTADSGMIRVGNAEFWTARANPPTQRIAAGHSVRIVYVDGLTAYVDPLPVSPETAPAPAASAPTELAREES